MLTVEQIRSRVEKIREVKGDSEVAHQREDELVWEVIKDIAMDGEGAREKAWAVLGCKKIRFSRWCA